MTRSLEAIKPQLDRIIERIVQEYRPLKIILFGSYAHGQPHEGSDVDLLVIKEDVPPARWQRYVEVCRCIRGLRRGLSIEAHVVTPQELSEGLRLINPFYREITEQGVVLYDTTTDRRIGTMAMAS
ncbi:MAG: nucleotidyltransferase domain-containing protein [Verrucomicrobiae bacterium]|nr:nucleotidyltransferase domain-containing protein [Verrucomicrobiae bacterium]